MIKVNNTDKKKKSFFVIIIEIIKLFFDIIKLDAPNYAGENTNPFIPTIIAKDKEKNNNSEAKEEIAKRDGMKNFENKKDDINLDNLNDNLEKIKSSYEGQDNQPAFLNLLNSLEKEEEKEEEPSPPTQDNAQYEEKNEKKEKSESKEEIQKISTKESTEKNGYEKIETMYSSYINFISSDNLIDENIVKSNTINSKLLGQKTQRTKNQNDSDKKEDKKKNNNIKKEILIKKNEIMDYRTNNLNNNLINHEEENNKKPSHLNDYTRKCLKAPFDYIRTMIEKFGGGLKLNAPNLDNFFGGKKINEVHLNYNMYQLLSLDKKHQNKERIRNACNLDKEVFELNGGDKEKFCYFLTRTYKSLFTNYVKNYKEFEINGDKTTIDEFKNIDDIIELKGIEDSKTFKKISKDISDDFKDYGERSSSIMKRVFFVKVKITELENYIVEEQNKKNLKSINISLDEKIDYNIIKSIEENNIKKINEGFPNLDNGFNIPGVFSNNLIGNRSTGYFSNENCIEFDSDLDSLNCLNSSSKNLEVPSNLNDIILS